MRALGLTLLAATFFACGARTPLALGGVDLDETPDAAEPGDDANVAADDDAGDVAAPVLPDCVDPATSLIFAISKGPPSELYSFDPPNSLYVDIGTLDCPQSSAPQAFSIAIDRKGTAYVLTTNYGDPAEGALWRVSTANAHCEPIFAYASGQLGFSVFGMAFATSGAPSGETLFIQGNALLGSNPGFATLDTTSFQVAYIGSSRMPGIVIGQLAGTADGRIFALYSTGSANPGSLLFGPIDTMTGEVQSQITPRSYMGGGFAVADWQGTAYSFTSEGGSVTGATAILSDTGLGDVNAVIAGAGASTCIAGKP